QPVTFTATVSPVAPGGQAAGSAAPTGTVSFTINGAAVGTPQPVTNGQASITLPAGTLAALNAGTYRVDASYSGDANYRPGPDTASGELVQTVSKATTLVSVTPPAASHFGDSVTFTAVISAQAPANGVPTGRVMFSEGTVLLSVGTVNPQTGEASFST